MKLLFFFLGIVITPLYAQEYLTELPENPEPNKCYAKCIVPDEYKNDTIRIMTRPAYQKLKVIPAQYKVEVQDIVIRPASKRFINVPAVYETKIDTLWIKDPYHKLKVIPTSFTTSIKEVEIKSESGRWVAGENDPDCPSIDPADCRIFHYVVDEPINRKIPIQQILSPAVTTKKKVTGAYELITRQVEVTPARTITEIIPAKTIKKKRNVLIKDETTKSVTIPARYEEVIKKILVKKGGMNAWREVPCTIPKREILPSIHYDLGSDKLKDGAKKIVDKHILDFLVKNKKAIVEIGSHTDARGSDQFNLELSERRAKNVVEYLISKGIDSSRLIAVGYGETLLLNQCNNTSNCSDQEHLENRRTEFRVF